MHMYVYSVPCVESSSVVTTEWELNFLPTVEGVDGQRGRGGSCGFNIFSVPYFCGRARNKYFLHSYTDGGEEGWEWSANFFSWTSYDIELNTESR